MDDDGGGSITEHQTNELKTIVLSVIMFMKQIDTNEVPGGQDMFVAEINAALAEFWEDFDKNINERDWNNVAFLETIVPTMNMGLFDETAVRSLERMLRLAQKYKFAFTNPSGFKNQIDLFENIIKIYTEKHNNNQKYRDTTGSCLVASIMRSLYK